MPMMVGMSVSCFFGAACARAAFWLDVAAATGVLGCVHGLCASCVRGARPRSRVAGCLS